MTMQLRRSTVIGRYFAVSYVALLANMLPLLRGIDVPGPLTAV